jgi:hypothetical protein
LGNHQGFRFQADLCSGCGKVHEAAKRRVWWLGTVKWVSVF